MCGPYAYVFKKYENLNVIQNFFDSNPPPSSVYIKTCAGGGGAFIAKVFLWIIEASLDFALNL